MFSYCGYKTTIFTLNVDKYNIFKQKKGKKTVLAIAIILFTH